MKTDYFWSSYMAFEKFFKFSDACWFRWTFLIKLLSFEFFEVDSNLLPIGALRAFNNPRNSFTVASIHFSSGVDMFTNDVKSDRNTSQRVTVYFLSDAREVISGHSEIFNQMSCMNSHIVFPIMQLFYCIPLFVPTTDWNKRKTEINHDI